jgi:hypothetical protein
MEIGTVAILSARVLTAVSGAYGLNTRRQSTASLEDAITGKDPVPASALKKIMYRSHEK